MPDVSVIIPTRNRRRLVHRAVASALAQQDVDLEVIVIDDASDDGTAESLERVGDDRLRLLRVDERRGAAHARNLGIETAEGQLLAFLDSDDVWLPDKLRRQLEVLPPGEQGAVYCRHYYAQGTYVHPARVEMPTGDIHARVAAGWCPSIMSNLVVDREVAQQCSFDTGLTSFQDVDFLLKVSRIRRFRVVDAPLTIVDRSAGDRISGTWRRRRAAVEHLRRTWLERLDPALRQSFTRACERWEWYIDVADQAEHPLPSAALRLLRRGWKLGIAPRILAGAAVRNSSGKAIDIQRRFSRLRGRARDDLAWLLVDFDPTP